MALKRMDNVGIADRASTPTKTCDLRSRTASVLLAPVRDQIEDVGRKPHLGAWLPGSDGSVHTRIQWSMSGIVATVKSAFAASPRYLTSGPRFVAASRSRSRAPWIARKGFVNARNASPGSVKAWDRRSGAAFTHCVTMAAIAPWTDARSWSLTLAIAEVNASRSLLSSSDELNVGEL